MRQSGTPLDPPLQVQGITLFTLFHNPTELRLKTVNQKGEKKSAVLKWDRT